MRPQFAYRSSRASSRGRRIGSLALALMALAPSAFSAATAPAATEIPPECGTRATFDRELYKRLGADAPTRSVQISITEASHQFHLRVQIGNEVRELDDASCTELFRASVVVAVAMLMHEPAKNAAPPPPAVRPRPAPLRDYPRLSVAAGAGLGVGTLPKPVLALELESKLLWRRFGVGVNLRYLLPALKIDAEDKHLKVQALGAGVSGIFRPSRLWEARLGFAAQRLAGEGGHGIAKPDTDSAWAAGPTLGLGFFPIQTEPFWAGLGAEGQLNAVRARFQILHYSQDVTNPAQEIYRAPWIAGSAFVRLGLVW
jgi:hypothetical protein